MEGRRNRRERERKKRGRGSNFGKVSTSKWGVAFSSTHRLAILRATFEKKNDDVPLRAHVEGV